MALPQQTIDKWKSQKFITIDGYRSTSLDFNQAKGFAFSARTQETQQVILKIRIENKFGKYYICLDKEDYTLYPDEQEVLL